MATSSSKKKTGTAKKSAPAAKKPASAPKKQTAAPKKQPAAKAASAAAPTAPTWPYALACIVLSLLAFLGLFHAEGVVIDGFAGFLCGIMGWAFGRSRLRCCCWRGSLCAIQSDTSVCA